MPPNVPTGYSALTKLGGKAQGQLGIVWEFVCCSQMEACGAPMLTHDGGDNSSACHGNANTSIVWSVLPTVF